MSLAGPIQAKAAELGAHVVRMTTTAGSGHPSSALSLAHIVTALMYHHMRWDPADPWHPAADRLVLSEGHAVPIVYAAYADLGGVIGRDRDHARPLTVDDLDGLRQAGSVLDGHPNPAKGFPFFDAATGSLGQGLSVAAGLAIGARLRNCDRRLYVIIGDGESREGQIWEAADFIADHHLVNVTAIFNCNGQGQTDVVSAQQSAQALGSKLAAFGWEVIPVDGHDGDAVIWALRRAADLSAPVALVAATEKGWGVPDLKDKSNHGKPLPADKLLAALRSLDAIRTDGAAPAESPAAVPPAPPNDLPDHLPDAASFQTAVENAGFATALIKGRLATRRAYGAALLELGRLSERIVVLDGDVSNSTFADLFARGYPERFSECKIAEQNMVSTAVGLAASGFIPFVSSFAKF
ncbi:MAG: thiamine pyrophosphate-dependent enzyme, partial [Phycisphaerae bacterium]